MFKRKRDSQMMTVLFFETCMVFLAAWLTSRINSSDVKQSGLIVITLLHLVIFFLTDFYHGYNRRGYLMEFQATLRYSSFFLFALICMTFMARDLFIISRRGVIYFTAINFFLVYLTNIVLKYLRRHFFSKISRNRAILVISESQRLEDTLEKLNTSIAQTDLDGQITAVVLMDKKKLTKGIYPQVEASEMIQYATTHVIDHVFINLQHVKYNIAELASNFEAMGIDVSINIDTFSYPISGEKKLQSFSGFNVVTVSSKFYSYSHILAKRMLDITGALVGLVLCGLLGLVVVPIIKKDGGPAIFSQKRVGENGRIFNFYKFRSMHVNAEQMKQDLMDQNQMDGLMFKMDNDPRITKIGHFIRKTSIDELPQFWNVLKGDMSLVGTRPPTLDEYNQYTPEQKRRLSFKPGITGLWQVSGRSEIKDFDQVVKLDVAYIDNWTIWSDIKILFKTIVVVFKREGSK